MSTPRFTLITATLNRAQYLREAILSVESERRDDVEHVIIDGGSTDGTFEMLKQWPHLRVHSGKDSGIYDAFNKGLALATGEFVHFLNSDDLLVPGGLAAVAAASQDETVDVVSGGVEFFEDSGSGPGRLLRRETSDEGLEFSLHQVLSGLPAINARFFRRQLIQRVGEFNLRYRIASDREYLVRLALERPRGVVVNDMVYRYRIHSESLTLHETDRDVNRMQAEHVKLAEQYLADPTLRNDDRAELRGLLVRESAALAIDRLMAGDRKAALQWAQRGCRASQWWPLAAAKRLGGSLLGRTPRSASRASARNTLK